jgi:hypothetical protein
MSIPAAVFPQPGVLSVGVVAGARSDRVKQAQIILAVDIRSGELLVESAAEVNPLSGSHVRLLETRDAGDDVFSDHRLDIHEFGKDADLPSFTGPQGAK